MSIMRGERGHHGPETKHQARGWHDVLVDEQGGCTHVMHGRIRMTIDPLASSTIPGRRTSEFQPTRKTLLAPKVKRREIVRRDA